VTGANGFGTAYNSFSPVTEIMIWVAMLILLCCSGAVSGSETALFALTRKDLEAARRSENRRLQRPHRLMQRARSVLMTVLIANTLVNVAIFSLSYAAVQHLGPERPALAAGIGVCVLLSVILFGELVPKVAALANPRALAPFAAGFISILQTVLGPAQWLLSVLIVNPAIRLISPGDHAAEPVTTDELRLLVEQSAREGHIGTTENEMLQGVVGMAEVSVREVMTPRVDIESVTLNDGPTALHEAARKTRKRVLPVRGRDVDDIRGFVYARELLLFPKASLATLLRPADFIPEQANLAHVIRHFGAVGGHVAIVVDEYGGTAGLVTNEDVVEWIVGELPTSDVESPAAVAEPIDENTYRVAGDLGIGAWADRFGVTEVDRHVSTVGGLILSKLGRLPRVGDSVRIRNLTLTVEAMGRHRIEWVRLHRDGQTSNEEAPAIS